MQLIPVIEVRHGKCVHTERKNEFETEVVKQNVIEVLTPWVEKGIERIHLVDVDAIESGEPENVDLIATIKKHFPALKIQVIGGIKCIESAYVWVDGGADFVVLNGKAMRRKNLLDDACIEFPGKIIVEIDCRAGGVSTSVNEPAFSLSALATQLSNDGVAGLVVTEVGERGQLRDNRLPCLEGMLKDEDMPVFVNGAIERMADLQNVLHLHSQKISGVLVGKALFRDFCLVEAKNLITSFQPA